MQKLFCVTFEAEVDMVVLADSEHDAREKAEDNTWDLDPEWYTTARVIEKRIQIPAGWENDYPFGDCPEEEIYKGTCSEIFDALEEKWAEEERKRKIAEELDRKQLKFDFMYDGEELEKSENTSETRTPDIWK